MFTVGSAIKTRCGSPKEPYWEYGTVTEIRTRENGDVMYKVNWDDSSYDYLYDFEMEFAD